jgi:hypothetical protein
MPLAIFLTLFIIVDGIVMFVVLKRFYERRAAFGGNPGITRFANLAVEEAKSTMSANYNGDPSTLPGVLQVLVERLSERAAEQGITTDRSMLKGFARNAVIAIKAAPERDVNAALESVS